MLLPPRLAASMATRGVEVAAAKARRRLRHHATVFAGSVAAAAAEPPPPHSQIVAMRELFERQNGRPPPPPLAVADDGSLLDSTVAALRDGVADAVGREDFLEAERLHRALAVLGPQEQPLRFEDCASLSLDGKADFFAKNGFCVVPKCFEGAELERLQRSWRRAQQPAREQYEAWRDTGAEVDLPHGKLWFDIPVKTLLEESVSDGGDPVLLQLLGPAPLLPVLDRIVGTPELCGVQPRTLAPDTPEVVSGYSGWHRDGEQGPTNDLLRSRGRVVKAFVYIFDVGPEQGATSVVPGSFRLATGPQWLTRQYGFGANEAEGGELPVTAMPNHFKFAAKAGDCIVFDIASWHSAMPNHTGLDREAVILGYKNGSHVGRATARTGDMPTPELLRELDERGLLSDEHKGLLREIYQP